MKYYYYKIAKQAVRYSTVPCQTRFLHAWRRIWRPMAPHGAAWRRMAPHGALAPLIFFVFSLPSLYNKCHLKNINSEIIPAFFLTFLTGVDRAATQRFWLVRPARHRRWWRAWSIGNLYQVCAAAPATPMLILSERAQPF